MTVDKEMTNSRDFHQATIEIARVSETLMEVADALVFTGNRELAHRLYKQALYLMEQRKIVRACWDNELNWKVQRSMQSSVNLLNAALAGAAVASADKK